MKQTVLKGKFNYTPQQALYDVTVRKPFNWLWLLLLLLLLPLFIRCEREVEVEVVDESGTPVQNVAVALDCNEHYLYKEGFFTTLPVHADGKTNSKGKVTFSGLSTSVWSYLFHPSVKMRVSAVPPHPYEPAEVEETYHNTSHVLIKLATLPEDIPVRVVDSMTGNPLVGAEVVATVNGNGVGVFVTDGSGVAMIPGIHPTDVVSLVGRKEHYAVNDKSIRRMKGTDLNSDPMKEIPLDKIYECDDNVQYESAAKPLIVIHDIDMHQDTGTFNLDVVTYSQPDRFVVKDASGKQLLDTGFISTGSSSRTFTVNFTTRKITIEAYADPDGPETSVWQIYPHCPQ